MTHEAIDRIQASFEHVTHHFARLVDRFYIRLFAACPAARDLFKVDMKTQAGHLSAALALIVRNLPMLDALEHPLMELGAAHARMGVRPEHYPAACEALLFSLAEELGDRWTSELSGDWRGFVERVTGHMLAGSLESN
jgi:hemoglobin-like flavoprotein